MKDIITWKDQTYEMEWFDDIDFSKLSPIEQVYGFLFDEEDNLCVVRPTEERGWRLPGGGPEPEDDDWKATVIREADEEADIELDIDSLTPTGYLKITPISDNCEKGVHYALRAIGKIIKVNEQTEDIAEGLINDREFISHNKFLEYCPWGKIGKCQINKAVKDKFK